MRQGRVQLKGSVYALQEPVSGAYIALRGARPQITHQLHLATIVPATDECLGCLQTLASSKLAGTGTPHELVRVDA
jgi:hypothetical protein